MHTRMSGGPPGDWKIELNGVGLGRPRGGPVKDGFGNGVKLKDGFGNGVKLKDGVDMTQRSGLGWVREGLVGTWGPPLDVSGLDAGWRDKYRRRRGRLGGGRGRGAGEGERHYKDGSVGRDVDDRRPARDYSQE